VEIKERVGGLFVSEFWARGEGASFFVIKYCWNISVEGHDQCWILFCCLFCIFKQKLGMMWRRTYWRVCFLKKAYQTQLRSCLDYHLIRQSWRITFWFSGWPDSDSPSFDSIVPFQIRIFDNIWGWILVLGFLYFISNILERMKSPLALILKDGWLDWLFTHIF